MTVEYTCRATGGTTFEIYAADTFLGTIEAGGIADGQWVGGMEDVLAAAKEHGLIPAGVGRIIEVI